MRPVCRDSTPACVGQMAPLQMCELTQHSHPCPQPAEKPRAFDLVDRKQLQPRHPAGIIILRASDVSEGQSIWPRHVACIDVLYKQSSSCNQILGCPFTQTPRKMVVTLPILALMKASTPEKSRFSPIRSCFPRFPKSMSGLTTSLVLFSHGLASRSSTKFVSART